MARLIYAAITSLDGYIADRDGNFDWAAPNEEVFSFVNDLERPIGTYLFGRRMYEVMRYWETARADSALSPVEREFADIWQTADKIVYSTTLETVSTTRTRLERTFDPAAVRQMKLAAERDITVGGSALAGCAMAGGLVDEYQLYLTPVIVGGGTRALPEGVQVTLDLIDEHRFGNGVVFLRYRTGM